MRPPLALADLGGHREHLNPPLILNSVLMVSLPSVLIYLDPPVTQSLTHSLPTYPAQCVCVSILLLFSVSYTSTVKQSLRVEKNIRTQAKSQSRISK